LAGFSTQLLPFQYLKYSIFQLLPSQTFTLVGGTDGELEAEELSELLGDKEGDSDGDSEDDPRLGLEDGLDDTELD
jgi:hypothetical protein